MQKTFAILLLLGLIMVACKARKDVDATYSFQEGKEKSDTSNMAPITIYSIKEVFTMKLLEFDKNNLRKLRNLDTIRNILDNIGPVFYYDLFYELLHEVYVPIGCKWGRIQIKEGTEVLLETTLNDAQVLSLINCDKKGSTTSNIDYLKNKMTVFDCLYKEDKMIVESTYMLDGKVEVSLYLVFIAAGSEEYNRI